MCYPIVWVNSFQQVDAMSNASSAVKNFLRMTSFLVLLIAIVANAQDKDADAKAKSGSDAETPASPSSSPGERIRNP
jgi:hypothetical protein